jgi:hypothetical protein
VKFPKVVEAWAMVPSKYVQEAVNNCEDYLKQEYAKLDISPEQGPEQVTYFQSVIGVLR